ncbi:hypothetical protein LC065_12375 [Halobacillus litoralis]|uniref:hypothetical protein n=1 Tax=Halobacillus litoralis TaxID=45668 RepID=UPI001CFCDBC2|nr:hypothetical protein [Halobacillus litoralis]WLR46377.1 hypothetical protein LC065_12375 [Halobacillus litoralis]
MNRVILLFFCGLLFLNITAQASSPFVISEEGAAGYYYQVTKNEDTYTWLIEGKGRMLTVIETEENEQDLESFRFGVENVSSHLSALWMTGLFFVIASTLTLYLGNKQRRVVKESLPVIILALCVPIYILVSASVDLNHALHKTELYFQLLLK